MNRKMIKDKLSLLPAITWLLFDESKNGDVIYVGKAKKLKFVFLLILLELIIIKQLN